MLELRQILELSSSNVVYISAICAMGLIMMLVPLTVQAHLSEIETVSLKTTIGDAAYSATYNVAVTCTDTILAYGLNLFVPHNDPSDRYVIDGGSIRLGTTTLAHASYTAEKDHMSANLLGRHDGMKYPLLIPQYSPLIIPISVTDSEPGFPAKATLDITYEGNPDTTCRTSEIRGPQNIGLMVRMSLERGMDRIVAANMAVNDYNQYLESIGEQWRLELVVKDSGLKADEVLEIIQEFTDEDIRLIVGPSSSGSISAIREHIHHNDMLVISCCSTAPSLSLPDHIFRITPDDTNQAKALARIMADDGIISAVVAYRDDPYGQGLYRALAVEMEKRGSVVATGVPYPTDTTNFDDAAQSLADEIDGMSNAAIVAISSSEVASLIESAMKHDILDDVKWYGSEAVVNHRDVARGDMGAFSEKVGLSGAIVAAPSSPLRNDLEPRLAAELGLQPGEVPSTFLYSMYDAILILGKAILSTQSTDTERLVEAIPYVAAHTHGVFPDRLDENVDLAITNYGIWEVRDAAWVRTGNLVQDTDVIVPYLP